MHLVLPEPVSDRAGPVEILPGVHVRIGDAIALPSDREAWHGRVIGMGMVVTVQHLLADPGWAFTLVATRSHDPSDRTRTLHAFFELFDRGVVVTIIARDAECLERERERVLRMLRSADIDRRQREVVALAQIWDAT